MDLFTDVVFLSRLQFTLTVAFHFVFVPLSIGIGLICAIAQTRAYRSGSAEDDEAARFWVKLFTTTFVIGVATGITMEFSFGTNWADYSRFVGDIFGAPLAAEALFAFFLESVFLGVVLFGRGKVSPKMYCVSAWLVWGGSCLSALWILIANSWMQTPAGAELSADGSKAILTDFFAAAFNPTTGVRYFHTVTAAIVIGGLVAMSVAAYHYMKGEKLDFAKKTMKTGVVVALVATCALFVSAHSTALSVWNEQPTKLASMEGMYEDEAPPLYLFGWVDEATGEVIGPALPGFTSFLATFTFDTVYPGLESLSQTERYGDLDPGQMPVNAIFQVYHLMVALSGVIIVVVLVALFALRKDKIGKWGWLQKLLVIGPIFPFAAIEAGWFTAELGRQPWVVYPSEHAPDGIALLTGKAVSVSVSAPELLLTIVLFCAIYLLLFVAWLRLASGIVKTGPVAATGEGFNLDLIADKISGDDRADAAVDTRDKAALSSAQPDGATSGSAGEGADVAEAGADASALPGSADEKGGE